MVYFRYLFVTNILQLVTCFIINIFIMFFLSLSIMSESLKKLLMQIAENAEWGGSYSIPIGLFSQTMQGRQLTNEQVRKLHAANMREIRGILRTIGHKKTFKIKTQFPGYIVTFVRQPPRNTLHADRF